MKAAGKHKRLFTRIKDQRGATVVMVAVLMVVLLGFTALAVDIGHLSVVQNELRNAADAGALAGARFLYNEYGTAINEGANQIAHDAATANKSEQAPVEVNWSAGNEGDAQRGHWSFGLGSLARGFYPNDSLNPVDLWDVSTVELDENLNFINAIRVQTRRQATPADSYFARIFGIENFPVINKLFKTDDPIDAVAYIGFAGTQEPGEVDQPIAICKQSISGDGEYTCSIGRMISSGMNDDYHETGGWTSFNQDDPCTGGTNSQEVRSLVCGDGNPAMLFLGQAVATSGGEIQVAFDQLRQCWENETGKTVPWNLTLPVINCEGNNVGTCETVVGAVNVNVIWITGAGEDPDYSEVPTRMGDYWPAPGNEGLVGEARWINFADHFNLRNVDGSLISTRDDKGYLKKTIYFLPDCTEHELKGLSGGENFGILAKIPVLVE